MRKMKKRLMRREREREVRGEEKRLAIQGSKLGCSGNNNERGLGFLI